MSAELQLKTPKRIAARPDDVRSLCELLDGRGWLKAQEIMLVHPTFRERYIRLTAASSQGQIVSGQKGYKLTTQCTPDEALHAMNWLRSQAKLMTLRSLEIGKVFHCAATNQGPARHPSFLR